jgi:hypothetical protein
MDIYQYILYVTSPSLCLSYTDTDTQGHRDTGMQSGSLSSTELISCSKHTDDFYVVLDVSSDGQTRWHCVVVELFRYTPSDVSPGGLHLHVSTSNYMSEVRSCSP